MMENDSRSESPKRPTRLEILPDIHEHATPRVRRPLFRPQKFDDGRRNSFDGVCESQLPTLPDLGFVAKKKIGVLNSPLRFGTRALRRWSSAQIAAVGGNGKPNQSPTRTATAPRFRRVSSMPNGDQNSSILEIGSSLGMEDLLMETTPKNYAKHRMNKPQANSYEWQHRGNCSLPLIMVTPHDSDPEFMSPPTSGIQQRSLVGSQDISASVPRNFVLRRQLSENNGVTRRGSVCSPMSSGRSSRRDFVFSCYDYPSGGGETGNLVRMRNKVMGNSAPSLTFPGKDSSPAAISRRESTAVQQRHNDQFNFFPLVVAQDTV